MAELVFSTIGQAIGARLPGVLSVLGAELGRAGGALLGRSIDQTLFGTTAHREGARLTDLHLQGSTEGASIPAVYGSVRIAGQVIWAARFKEHAETQESGGGKGGGPRVSSRSYSYTLSFAVGLCEGEVARIGRVWANGEAFDLSQVAWRLHQGTEMQTPDALIEAIEGANAAPAYRGLAYVVFEDLPLEAFGNTIPQLSFEMIRPAPGASPGPRFEERVRGVCLIPGSGEFVYATTPVVRRSGPGQEAAENVHAEHERANISVSLDQLAQDLPNCETVLLVAAWFGDDLRAGVCQLRPGVELAAKETSPSAWKAGGVSRGGAHVVSLFEGAPAFGGTPSDASVLEAIAALKARGYKVGLYPFVLMDVPAGNGRADPYGGAEQAAYPWRGRISLHPAAGQPGSPDKTSAAATQISTFFGAAAPGDFGVSGGLPSYSGPAEWSYRRFVLHYAKLAALAGVVDYFIIGSELRALSTARSGASTYPAVSALISLANDARALLPGAKLTYAADWSEYLGHQPQDGSGDVFFHLDPLWASANIDAIGVDWYAPLTDWRAGSAHLDAELGPNIHDLAYLEGRIEAGENFDWYYADEAARAAQTRTPIADGAYNEPWVFRAKDLRNFWARAHHDRPGGVRAGAPTAWTPQSKPIWLIELGCPAIDKGSNAPNLFIDAKSDESAPPPFSTGARDDLIQRRTLEAYHIHWAEDSPDNPVSAITGKPMIEEMMVWCWDARPYPAFPARSDIWTDGASWRLGHWLNGRAGLSGLGEVVADLCRRAGLESFDISSLRGAVSGYVADAPATARGLLEPLMAAYDFTACESQGVISFFHHGERAPVTLAAGEFTAASAGDAFARRGDAAETPIEARVRFLDGGRDFLLGDVSARRLDRAEGGVETVAAPLVLEPQAADEIAQRVLAQARAGAETLRIELGPARLALEPGDAIMLDGQIDAFEIVRAEDAAARRLELRRARAASAPLASLGEARAPVLPVLAPTPAFSILDLPPLPGAESDERPLIAISAAPWFGAHDLYGGAEPARRGGVSRPSVMGELLWALWPGPVDRWDEGNVTRIKLYGGALASVGKDALLNGSNTFAIESGGEWEILQARDCVLVGANEYELSGLLRGRLGSGHAMAAPHPIGARIVKLDSSLGRANISSHEWGEALGFVAPPAGAGASDPRAAASDIEMLRAWARPWAPAHVRAKKLSSGDIEITWIRCARLGGDAWGAGDPPLGGVAEAYLIEIMAGASVAREMAATAPACTYTLAQQTADFGGAASSLTVRIAQLGEAGAPGLKMELTITL